MKKIMRNTTLSDVVLNDVGITLFPGQEYSIPPQDWPLWAASNDIVENLVGKRVVLNDGSYDLSVRYAIGILQDNQAVINEYYTLVQGDDILVGNGEILYLDDEMWSTDNVPFGIDEQLIEDDPY